MKYALYNGVRTHAKDVSSGAQGNDLWFQEFEVVACVGKYRQYWKYSGGKPPYPKGYENETEWHASWKVPILDKYCEVICGENREHRADIKTDEYVIEIQKSSMDGFDVIERNEFYSKLSGNRLVWIVNVEKPWKENRIKSELDFRHKDGRFIIKWSHAWKWVKEIAVTNDTYLYLDFNPRSDKLIYMFIHKKKLYGYWVKKMKFFNKYLSGIMKPEYEINEELLRIFNEV